MVVSVFQFWIFFLTLLDYSSLAGVKPEMLLLQGHCLKPQWPLKATGTPQCATLIAWLGSVLVSLTWSLQWLSYRKVSILYLWSVMCCTCSMLQQGYSQFQSKMLSEDELSLNRKFLTPADKDNLFTIDHFPLWYRLAVENNPGSFYFYPVNDKGLSLISLFFFFSGLNRKYCSHPISLTS